MKKKILIALFITASFLTTKAQYTKLFDFAGTANGSGPNGSFISDGTFLYGITSGGGTNSDGTIFKINPDGTGYFKLLDFESTANGSNPNSSLISDGTFLYGMNHDGGPNGYGTIFKIMPDGTGYSKLLDFAGAVNGGSPWGSLISDGTSLYGMTFVGGANGLGLIFKINPDGTGFTDLMDFSGTTNGSNPRGSLISDGTFFYGMTSSGGSNDYGTIFKIMPDGTGYSKLFDFAGTTNGRGPRGSLIFDGTFLYGMTYNGGASNLGVIFKIKPNGTGFLKLLDFAGSTNGSYPYGSLFSDGTFLYGMTSSGGISSLGVIFKINPDGTGYSKLLNFSGTVNGSGPQGSFISDGTFLYGVTHSGGANSIGVIFKYGIATDIADNNSATEFNLYPNPTIGVFSLSGLPLDVRSIEIYNVLGEKIYSTKCNKQQIKYDIDISSSPKGIYFIKFYAEVEIYTEKIFLH